MMVTPSVKLVRPLGEGGMGAVWVADHLALRTQVVVKFIASGLKDSKEATERFSREAAAAAQVKSPHVVQTFDHGFTADGIPYIVMELLEGRDLGAVPRAGGPRARPSSSSRSSRSSRARSTARTSAGIVHRDIKPGNIFLCDGGRGEVFVKLLDFGIAKGVDVPAHRQRDEDRRDDRLAVLHEPRADPRLEDGRPPERSLVASASSPTRRSPAQKPFDAETMGGLAIRIHSEPLPLPSTRRPGSRRRRRRVVPAGVRAAGRPSASRPRRRWPRRSPPRSAARCRGRVELPRVEHGRERERVGR